MAEWCLRSSYASSGRQEHHMGRTYSRTAVFNGSMALSPKPLQINHLPTPKHIVCKWFDEGTCPHVQDYTDSSGTSTFRHVCLYCFKAVKRNNNYMEAECLAKKTVVEWDQCDHNSVCTEDNDCTFIKGGNGLFFKGSAHSYQGKAHRLLLQNTCVNIVKMPSFGPYGNVKDRNIQQFIGVPLF